MGFDDESSRQAIRQWIEQQWSELERKSYYQLLGIEKSASEHEIRTAYYHLVARFHPDLYYDVLDAPTRAKLVSVYSRLVEGYLVLRDAVKRTHYGRGLEQNKLRWTVEEERAAPRRDSDADVANPNARRFYKMGKVAMAAGDGKSAVMNLKLALSVDPDNLRIQAELAKAEGMARGK